MCLGGLLFFFFFKQKTAYEMRISDWSSDVCSSDLKDALVVASPPPLAFWKRDIYWRTADRYGTANFVLGVGGNVDLTGSPTGMDDPRIESWAKADPAARAFLFWSRMPVAQKDGDAILLREIGRAHV